MPTEKFLKLKQSRQDDIIKSLTREFATKDYNTLSVKDLSSNASISRGSFYLYFEDKFDAFLTIVKAYKTRMEKDLLKLQQASNTTKEIILSVFDYFTHLSNFEHSLLENISNNLSLDVQDVLATGFEKFNNSINNFLTKEFNIETQQPPKTLLLKQEMLFNILISSLLETTIKKIDLNLARQKLNDKIEIIMKA